MVLSDNLGGCWTRWRNISISLIDGEKGEVKAQSSDNALFSTVMFAH
jgi:hypothetical protein